MAMISPTSRTTTSSPFFSAAAPAATAARISGAPTDTWEPRLLKRRAPVSSAVSVEAARPDGAYDRGGHEAVDGPTVAEPDPKVGRRHVEARDRHPGHAPARPGRLGAP